MDENIDKTRLIKPYETIKKEKVDETIVIEYNPDFIEANTEIWKDIFGYGGKYQVSNYGNVKSLSYGKYYKLMKCGTTDGGYKNVKLTLNGFKHYKIHRLVALHFIKGMTDIKKEVDHIDRNPTNNHYKNLKWASRTENNNNKDIVEYAKKYYISPLTKKFKLYWKNADGLCYSKLFLSAELANEWAEINLKSLDLMPYTKKSYLKHPGRKIDFKKWSDMLDCIKNYVIDFKKRPSEVDKDPNIKKYGYWLSLNLHNYKNRLSNMKEDQSLYFIAFDTFLKDKKFKKFFMYHLEGVQLRRTLLKITEYCDWYNKNGKQPKRSTSSQEDEYKLANWRSKVKLQSLPDDFKCKLVSVDSDFFKIG